MSLVAEMKPQLLVKSISSRHRKKERKHQNENLSLQMIVEGKLTHLMRSFKKYFFFQKVQYFGPREALTFSTDDQKRT